MFFKNILRKKRNGEKLTKEEIYFWIEGVKKQTIPDYQTAAMLMAIYFQGMDVEERSYLTLAMRDSGELMDFSQSGRYVIDKHSSGGIGDKTSLILAPWLACCGVVIPMVSGRGLGFTGGTLDKLESIDGFRVALNQEERKKAILEHGFFFAGQSAEIAPADKKLYALRDATETVEEISLITASILSKKLAEGLHGLVLDIKCGSGAFMKNLNEAQNLANSLVKTAQNAGVTCLALITRMDFPLGRYAGNLCEVFEAYEFVKPHSLYHNIFQNRIKWDSQSSTITLEGGIQGVEDNLVWVTTALAVAMLQLSQNISGEEALQKLNQVWQDGEVLSKLEKAFQYQGGELKKFLEKLHRAKKIWENGYSFVAPQDGYLNSCNGAMIGNLLVELGAGRKVAEDSVDPLVSLEMIAWEGKKLKAGEPICRIAKENLSDFEKAICQKTLEKAFTLSQNYTNDTGYILKQIQ